jgi:type II secretory pathway pseudopilin PulG
MDSPPGKNRTKNGFTLIEVLIATLIMVMAIVTVTAAVRQFIAQREKLRHYEQVYTAVLSLHDRIMNENFAGNSHKTGTLNGLDYTYDAKLMASANNYVVGVEPGLSGNKGIFTVMAYKINLELGGRTFEFYKTQYGKKVGIAQDEI